MKNIKWGFIGCGEVVEKKSGPAFSEVDGSSVVAVMSRSERRARRYAEQHGIPKWYTDAQELIDDADVNAVYVATPPSSHATYAIMAMKAGKPVYVEKPLASSYEDCARINRVSEQTGMPCFVAYYRRQLPYFEKVREIVERGVIGKVVNVQVRFSVPPREEDYAPDGRLPWRVLPDIAGGGYFYDMAPHQLDYLQQLFGVIVEARGISSNRGGLYKAEDTVNACFEFENGLSGSGSWCFVGHESAREDRIHLMGDRGSVSFSVFDYQPIRLNTSRGEESFAVPNPPYVQAPLIKNVIEHLQGISLCDSTCESATPVNWALDRILGKF
ncbi:MAG: Gfo/Idh/MocA family oxidoreductase [Prevotella sp.]|nr:Gfo/Idh/MocA family oxidoreductase [Prevotella sp.]